MMDFSHALCELKNGKLIRRRHWPAYRWLRIGPHYGGEVIQRRTLDDGAREHWTTWDVPHACLLATDWETV